MIDKATHYVVVEESQSPSKVWDVLAWFPFVESDLTKDEQYRRAVDIDGPDKVYEAYYARMDGLLFWTVLDQATSQDERVMDLDQAFEAARGVGIELADVWLYEEAIGDIVISFLQGCPSDATHEEIETAIRKRVK